MWLVRRVRGRSMVPALRPGMIVLARPKSVQPGNIVIAELQGREVIKRVKHYREGKYYLVGDNTLESTDSRELGPVKPEAIKGVMMIKFPLATAVKLPATARKVALGLAAIYLVMAVAQLVRFDKFVPILTPLFSEPWPLFVGAVLVLAEVFALPFLLGMPLSPLGKWASLACCWLAAIGWTVMAVITLGAAETGHLGEFVHLSPGVWAILCGGILLLSCAYISWQWRRRG